jgi:hypothetical protein
MRSSRRWVGGSNAGDWEAVGEMMHPAIAIRDPMMGAPARGRRDALERAKGQYAPFPDGVVDAPAPPCCVSRVGSSARRRSTPEVARS